MKIQQIELRNFRNYEELQLQPHEGINLFYGRNGSGKTNLLEAVHYCALGKSHRINNDQNAVRIGTEAASCSVRVQSKRVRSEIQVRLQPGESSRKTIYIDHTKIHRFSELMGKLRCVLFSPEDLGMIRGGPALRRRFLDMMISQLSPGYFIALQQYRTAMDQRNAILRTCRMNSTRPDSMIEDFERAMAENAVPILTERSRIGSMLGEKALETYRRISGREEEEFRIQYRSQLMHFTDVKEDMMRALRESREEDQRTGQSSCGPHRDDLGLTLNQKDMKLFASQGQVRTAALSIRLSQLKVIEKNAEDTPVLLLDDVMSELDKVRRMNLLDEIGSTQTFITFSDESDLESYQNNRTYYVSVLDQKGIVQEMKHGSESEALPLRDPDFT